MSPSNRLKLNLALLSVLVFYWFLDQAIPFATTPYDDVVITAEAASIANTKDLNQLTTDAEKLRSLTQAHPGLTSLSAFATDRASQAATRLLITRATHNIDLILSDWRIDEPSTLLAAALLDATERGVEIKMVIDDSAVHVADKTLFALARHPLIKIRVFHPKHRVSNYAGIRLWDTYFQFFPRKQNLREQSVIVDDLLAIQGGEYGEGNAIGRDFMLAGQALVGMRKHSDQLWQHPLSSDIAAVFPEHPYILHNLNPRDKKINHIYQAVQSYARKKTNQQTVHASLPEISNWSSSAYLHASSDQASVSVRLIELIQNARDSIQLQTTTPFFPQALLQAFAAARQRGVHIQLLCDSMSSSQSTSDFARYHTQREKLIALGIQIREFKPDFRANDAGIARLTDVMLIDQKTLYTGHFNLFAPSLLPASGLITSDPDIITQVGRALELNLAHYQVENPLNERPDQAVGVWRKMLYRVVGWWQG